MDRYTFKEIRFNQILTKRIEYAQISDLEANDT